MDGRGVGAVSVEAPVPAVAKKADSADVDVDAFRHIDIDVPERRQNGHRALPVVDRDVAQVEVEIPETAGSDGIPAQSQPTAPDDVAEQGRCVPGRPAARPGRRDEDIGQVFVKTRQFRANTSTQSGVNPLGEFLQSQPACKEMLTQRDNSLLTVVVRDAHGSVTHSRHTRPQMACQTTRGQWVKDVDSSLAGGWIEVATTSTRRRGRDQYAPGQRVRQRPGQRDRAAARGAAGPVAPGRPGGDGAAVAARAAAGADRGAAGVPPGHGAPLDRPVQRRGAGRAGGPAPAGSAPARRAAADQADLHATGPARPVDAAADPPLPGLAAGQHSAGSSRTSQQ